MVGMVEALFLEAVVALGGRSDAASRRAYATMARAYEGRAYHNLRHVERVLEAFRTIEKDLQPEDGAWATLALCYHDAVYDPQADDNEARSAAFARAELAPLGIDEADLAEIERLILATKDHAPTDPLAALVVDADLSILAAAPEEYDAYASAIRKEYGHVPDAAYRTGRTRVLQGLLRRERLFTSPLLDEAAGRENLEREIGALSA